jgi:hypothetical protein
MADTQAKKYLVDPQLQESLDLLLATYPGGLNSPDTIEERRDLISRYLSQFPQSDLVSRTDMKIESKNGGPDIPIRLYRPLYPTASNHIDCAVIV